MSDTQIVYYSKNSPFKVQLTDFDGSVFTAARMATITKMYLKYTPSVGAAAEIADSELIAHADVFDKLTYSATGELLINLGGVAFSEGRDEDVELVIYDTIYPDGRVQQPALDIQVSYAVAGDFTGAAVLTKATGVSALPPIEITDDYPVQAADFNRPALQANFLTAKEILLPTIIEAYDGAELSVDVLNIGDVKLLCSGTNKILNSSYTSLKGVQRYSTVTVRAVYSIGMWLIKTSTGSWGGL